MKRCMNHHEIYYAGSSQLQVDSSIYFPTNVNAQPISFAPDRESSRFEIASIHLSDNEGVTTVKPLNPIKGIEEISLREKARLRK